MLRRQSRLRREYMLQKAIQRKSSKTLEKQKLMKRTLETNTTLSGALRNDAIKLLGTQKYEVNGLNDSENIDDEYRFAASEDPKIMITTSHEPSARLKMFVKELRLIFPSAQKLNRGKYEIKQLMHACRANNVTDFIIVHENRGTPDNIIISHLPHGPTAYLNISNVIMRHDIPDTVPLSEQKPHLIFHNFTTPLGERIKTILKHLFPVPKEDSKRTITFANQDDVISFRHHTFKLAQSNLELFEVGPRMQLKLYQIKLGALDEIEAAETEWALRPYMNSAGKRRFLSDKDGLIEGAKQ